MGIISKILGQEKDNKKEYLKNITKSQIKKVNEDISKMMSNNDFWEEWYNNWMDNSKKFGENIDTNTDTITSIGNGQEVGSVEQFTDIFIPLGLSQDEIVETTIGEIVEQDSEFGEALKTILVKSGEKKAVDFNSNVKEWINSVLKLNGFPMFVTKYAKSPFANGLVLGRAWGAKGHSQWFKDVPPDIYKELENKQITYKNILGMQLGSHE